MVGKVVENNAKKKNLKRAVAVGLVIGAVCVMSVVGLADVTEPTSLVSASDLQLVADFGADAKATIPEMLSVIIPISLGISMLPLFIHKGISWIMGAVRRA